LADEGHISLFEGLVDELSTLCKRVWEERDEVESMGAQLAEGVGIDELAVGDEGDGIGIGESTGESGELESVGDGIGEVAVHHAGVQGEPRFSLKAQPEDELLEVGSSIL